MAFLALQPSRIHQHRRINKPHENSNPFRYHPHYGPYDDYYQCPWLMKGRPGRRSSRPYPIIRHCQYWYEEQSSLDFDAYLSAVERELLEAPDDVRANIFFLNFIKTFEPTWNKALWNHLSSCYPMEMISLAQRMWKGLRQEGRLSYRTRNVTSSSHQGNASGQSDQQGQIRGQEHSFHNRPHNGHHNCDRGNGGWGAKYEKDRAYRILTA